MEWVKIILIAIVLAVLTIVAIYAFSALLRILGVPLSFILLFALFVFILYSANDMMTFAKIMA